MGEAATGVTIDTGLLGIIVTIALALLAQVVLSIRHEAKQSQAMQDLTKTVSEFTVDTKNRFDSQDKIILGHTENIREHSAKIGVLEGTLFKSARS